jgi:manganese-dependent inorganic pyrophosphatase
MKFEKFQDHLLQTKRHLPLVVLSDRVRHIQLAVKMNVPAIVLIGVDQVEVVAPLFEAFSGTVYVSSLPTDETTQLLRMSIPLKSLMRSDQPPTLSLTDYFDDAKNILIRSDYPVLPVFDGTDFKGLVGRREFMQRPRKKVILMDHNEPSQYIAGVEDAEIVEIIDHHRFGPAKTSLPIFIDCEPIGSTCSLVYLNFRRHDVELDPETAILLLSGLISDTVILKSPTTTNKDREIARRLAAIAGVRDIKAFGEEMFSGGAALTSQEARKMIMADFKCFDEKGVKFGIGQCEVTTLEGISEIKENWMEVLETVRKENGLQWALMIITNIIKEDSALLCTKFQAESKLVYSRESEGQYFCPGVLSRKVQVLPAVMRALEDEE